MRYRYLTIIAGAAMAALVSCSTRGEQAEVKEEAEQIEAAHIEGREAARAFVNRQYKDSMQMQMEMVNAGAKRSKYEKMPKSRAAFDSAFISTVRTVRPEVAAELEKYRDKN